MAIASGLTIKIKNGAVLCCRALLNLRTKGCIPGAAFRNQEFVEQGCRFHASVDYTRKMLLCDSQTSGGLLICSAPHNTEIMVNKLRDAG